LAKKGGVLFISDMRKKRTISFDGEGDISHPQQRRKRFEPTTERKSVL